VKRAVAIALLVGVVAAPASATESTIVPGVGIGKVKLGMTLTQVKKALGTPQTINARKQLAGGRGYIEYGWNYSTIWVGFVNTKGSVLHAVLIGTDVVAQRTKSGIGVSTHIARVLAQPRARCYVGTDWLNHPYFDPERRLGSHCVIAGAGGRSTVFVLNCIHPRGYGCRDYTVHLLFVRTSF
jgi:hypothetical protein